MSSKKRKQSKGTVPEHTSKKLKQDTDIQAEKKDKGKGKETAFQVVHSSLVISIPPIFASNPRAGAEEMLDSMIMRYIPALEGVVLTHSNLTFLDNTASIQAECPFLVCKIAFDTTVWRPRVGMKLVGKINLCSPDHISLLVHKTFNVSIPRHHIPTDEWEFQYGAAENDPEFGAGAENIADGEERPEEEENGGTWIHRVTGTRLGEVDGYLEFTVIGLTVANEMLSLLGSLQVDPFSPMHVPATTQSNPADTTDVDMVEDALLGLSSNENAEDDDGDEVDSDEDTFQALNKKTSEATAELARRQAEEAKKEEEKKQKKKRKVKEVSVEVPKAGKKQKRSS